MPAELALIGVPTNSSGRVDGLARAPAVLRQCGLAAALARRPAFTDAGDLMLPAPQPARGPSGLLAEDALVTMIERVREAVAAARGSGRFPLLVGGDCPDDPRYAGGEHLSGCARRGATDAGLLHDVGKL